MFKGCTFCVSGKMQMGSRKDVEKCIKGYGGATAASVTGKVTHVVSTEEEKKSKTAKYVLAEGKGLPIVSEDFLEECKNQGKLLDPADFPIGGAKKAKKAPAKKAPAKKAAKRKAAAPAPAPAKAAKVAKASGGGSGGGNLPVDKFLAESKSDIHNNLAISGSVVENFGFTLNQTNIGANNNKFYIAQVIEDGGQFYSYQRWGRVGENGQTNVKKFNDGTWPSTKDVAIKDFEKKFKDKSGNKWEDRANFVNKPKKYDFVETETDADVTAAMDAKLADSNSSAAKKAARISNVKSYLDKPTQELVSWILDKDMFNQAMSDQKIDTAKCPLGAIKKAQVDKGAGVLSQINDLLTTGKKDGAGAKLSGSALNQELERLSSRFYSVIPHSFGRDVPPVIRDNEMLKAKLDLVTLLGDIEAIQGIDDSDEDKNPIDQKYEQLNAELDLLKPSSKEYKVCSKYLDATKSPYRPVKILNMWKVNREGEGDRFAEHEDVENRKLLWHGTNVAAVAAILKTGLKIFPVASCGSRVGRGIYLASENGKSAGYCRTAYVGNKMHGIMFLCEAPMGKIKEITRDDWQLTEAPKGFDSILAKGNTEPDPSKDTTLMIDGHEVTVPQGKPIPTGAGSNFAQSEYLVYKESQCRIRYVLRCEM